MRYLLDTHILLWTIADKNLSKELKNLLINPENDLFYSVISPWEVEIKHNKYPETFPLDANQLITLCGVSDIKPVNLQERHIKQLSTVEQKNVINHNDPFDRVMLAQAICDDFVFVTHDKKFKQYNDSHIMMV